MYTVTSAARIRMGSLDSEDWNDAAVPWNAQTRLADGGREDLAGVSVLRFRADGLVVEERDFWNAAAD